MAMRTFAKLGPELQSTDVPVFYATNRLVVIEKPEPLHTIIPTDDLRLGVAHVRVGDDKLDWETLHRLSTSAEPGERPIVHLESLEQIAVLKSDEAVGKSPDAKEFFAMVNVPPPAPTPSCWYMFTARTTPCPGRQRRRRVVSPFHRPAHGGCCLSSGRRPVISQVT